MIEGVKQHKWWGWGEEGKSYHHDDKPKFAPCVKNLCPGCRTWRSRHRGWRRRCVTPWSRSPAPPTCRPTTRPASRMASARVCVT